MTTYSSDSQGKFIPASQRPDGTWRKPRRVRDGYVPQEEVPLYESKGKIFSQKPLTKYPVGFCPEVIQKENEKEKQRQQKLRNPIPGLIINPDISKEKKPKNKNEAKTPGNNKKVTGKVEKERSNVEPEPSVSSLTSQLNDNFTIDPTIEISKKLKRLRKRLREIDLLHDKIKSGEILNPEKDQLEKVERKPELLAEIQNLEDQRKKIHESRDNK